MDISNLLNDYQAVLVSMLEAEELKQQEEQELPPEDDQPKKGIPKDHAIDPEVGNQPNNQEVAPKGPGNEDQ